MRLIEWQSNLDRVLSDYKNCSFAWGARDCLQFSFDVICALTGTMLYPEERGNYGEESEAVARLEAHGFKTQARLLAAHLPKTSVACARVGDLGVARGPAGEALVVFLQDGVFGWTKSGLRRFSRPRVIEAFAVG